MDETERTTVRLPLGLLDLARRKAAKDGRTLTSLIEEGLRLVVSDRPRASEPRAVELPVSKATGGLLPGIDLTHGWVMQEIEDEEYVERMKAFKP